MKLTRSNLFRIQFIEKNNWRGGGLMKRDLRGMIGNLLILNSPPPYFLVYNIFVDDSYV